MKMKWVWFLQHLVWILGLKPSTGGSLKAGNGGSTAATNRLGSGNANNSDNNLVGTLSNSSGTGSTISSSNVAVITTAVMAADLPVLSTMLSRLFESSRYLDDEALHYLIDALCKLSHEAMELAYCNRVILILYLHKHILFWLKNANNNNEYLSSKLTIFSKRKKLKYKINKKKMC